MESRPWSKSTHSRQKGVARTPPTVYQHRRFDDLFEGPAALKQASNSLLPTPVGRRAMQRMSLIVMVLLGTLAFAGHVCADESDDQQQRQRHSQAKAHFERAKKAFLDGQYQKAATEYLRAYELVPLPALLFNIGQCFRNVNENERAMAAFEAYLKAAPHAPNREAVKRLIANLRARQKQRPTEAAPAPSPESPQAPPTVAEPASPSEDSDPLADALDTEMGDLFADESPPATPPPSTTHETETPQPTTPPTATVQTTTSDQQQPRAPAGNAGPFYKQWWFWTFVGVGLVGAITGVAVALSTRTDLPESRIPTWELPTIRD